MVRNFRYVEDGRIALAGFPETAAAVDWLHEQGIRIVVSAHPVPAEAAARLAELGMEWRPFLIEDLSQGVPAGLVPLAQGINAAAEPVLIHCQGGGGRSGSIYAAALILRGVTPDQAIRQAGVEKEAQRAFLHGFAAGLDSTARPDR
jgi:protein tyrosine phosphatase (PTP) superfamily phosphohydrolase (DUF442 family)